MNQCAVGYDTCYPHPTTTNIPPRKMAYEQSENQKNGGKLQLNQFEQNCQNHTGLLDYSLTSRLPSSHDYQLYHHLQTQTTWRLQDSTNTIRDLDYSRPSSKPLLTFYLTTVQLIPFSPHQRKK